ncbi:MAG TPA: thermonuclease family protein [Methanothermobacter sp.]|nr:putative nuclease [Methanothermobacter sp. MT-2]HHW05016.1 thermonuclease family protein [Methanothermobacter sp.]HOK72522.1 thermonuclease family protein [Methanothermobacter sp.]HOL69415.1 thermonuclease family protein [Methanothermobacter sp.]HPQ04009.1 thermonuclease family protein [Methanothermobacter sp.]
MASKKDSNLLATLIGLCCLGILILAVIGSFLPDSTDTTDNITLTDNKTNETIPTNETTIPSNNSSQNIYEASGYCYHVVDGDTIDVEGIGRIRFVGVNTPERGQPGYQEAKDFVEEMCLGKTVYLDIDDAKKYDKYGRILAIVYVNGINLNAELLKRGYAEIMYIPPSEFDPYTWI